MCGRRPLSKEFFYSALRVRSDSFMCTAYCMRREAGGHDGIGRSGPHQAAALRCTLNHSGCPDLRLDRISITCVVLSLLKLDYARFPLVRPWPLPRGNVPRAP
jgi:hypothetical protein